MRHPYTGDESPWVPDALDLRFGSELGCVLLFVLWCVTHCRTSARHRVLLLTTLGVASAFELMATAVLRILLHNPGYCDYWAVPTIPTAVVASWCVGIMAHMELADRFRGLRPLELAGLDVMLLLLMDVMTEVGGVAHNCWAWPLSQSFVDGAPTAGVAGAVYSTVHGLAPELLQERWWGVAAANYYLVPGAIAIHSVVTRTVLPWTPAPSGSHARSPSPVAIAGIIVALPCLTVAWLGCCAWLQATVGHVAAVALVVGPCAAAAAKGLLREGVRLQGSPDLATVATLGSCYLLNTSRLLTTAWTWPQVALQFTCVAIACGAAVAPGSDEGKPKRQ